MTDNTEKPTIYIIDDDSLIRDYITQMLSRSDYQSEGFESGQAFLESDDENQCGCILLDLDLPGLDGLEVQSELNRRDSLLPIVFLTGSGDVPLSVQAIKAGAIDFLQKPFRKEVLIKSVEAALAVNLQRLEGRDRVDAILTRFNKLTERENEILEYLVSGQASLSNKEIARLVSISHRTVEQHRARIMEKTGAKSIGELIKLSSVVGITTD